MFFGVHEPRATLLLSDPPTSPFVTAALSDDEASRYLLETFVTTVIVMVLVQPATACAAASFSFANSVLFAALSRIVTPVPLCKTNHDSLARLRHDRANFEHTKSGGFIRCSLTGALRVPLQ